MSTERICALVEARTGLCFTGHQRRRMLTAVHNAVRTEAGGDEETYAELLEADPDAFRALLDALVVTESYFFRDPAQMALLAEVVLPELRLRGGARVDVWSAGCAGGEEAYSVAVLAVAAGLGDRTRVLGTDLSGAAIERARAARFGPWSRRDMPDEVADRWFVGTGTVREVRPDVRARVAFRPLGLLDGPPGRFDVVLCRNVLMYLTAPARERAAVVLEASLRPHGWLLLGASDPPLVAPGLARVRTDHGVVYRRSAEASVAAPGDRDAAARPTLPAHRAPVSPPPRATIPAEVAAAEAAAAPTATTATPSAEPEGARAWSLIEARRFEETLACVEQALARDPLDASLHYLAGVLQLHAGHARAAACEARAALYLDPELTVAHLLHGHAAAALGARQVAARSYERAAVGFARLPADQIVAGGDGQPAGYLAVAAARLSGEVADGR